MDHRAGFVNIIGNPNAGKSTLLNAIIGDKTAIISPKPQTTRHRLKALINTDNSQIIFSDTPGFIDDPAYKMQSQMNQYVRSAMIDADVLIFLVDPLQTEVSEDLILAEIQSLKVACPIFLVINKVDLLDELSLKEVLDKWNGLDLFNEIFVISALKKSGIDRLMSAIKSCLPIHPPYYPKTEWTDRSERFFTSEMIREQILLLYHQEIPYNVEVQIESFKRGESKKGAILRIEASIYTTRKTQKSILIGKDGKMIKKLGTAARKSIEAFFDENVFLALQVKARKAWRDDDKWLKNFGYLN